MHKMFSKSYIILPLEFALDYIVLNYYLLDTTCFTYAEDNFISDQLAWQDWLLQTTLHNWTNIVRKMCQHPL